MSRAPVPPQETGVQHVRSEESPQDSAHWAAVPQRLLDYVSDYLKSSQTHPASPGRLAPASVAEDVRKARTAWIGRMTTFSLRTVLDLLQGAPAAKATQLEPRVLELVAAAREIMYGDHLDPHGESQLVCRRLDRALEAFAADVEWEDQPEEETA